MLKIITACIVILTVSVLSGSIWFLNHHYDWTGQLARWQRQSARKSEADDIYGYTIVEASKMITPDQVKFLERGCKGPLVGEHAPIVSSCIMQVSRTIQERGCKDGIANYPAVLDRFMDAQRAGEIAFTCE